MARLLERVVSARRFGARPELGPATSLAAPPLIVEEDGERPMPVPDVFVISDAEAAPPRLRKGWLRQCAAARQVVLRVHDAAGLLGGDRALVVAASSSPLVRMHLARGGKALWIEAGWVVLGEGKTAETRLVEASRLAVGYGATARLALEDALLAAGAALALGLERAAVVAGLLACTPRDLAPGCLGLFAARGGHVLVDRVPDACALAAVGETLAAWRRRPELSVLGAPADDESGAALAELCARHLGPLVVRGPPGAPAYAGLAAWRFAARVRALAGGGPPWVVLGEAEAVRLALEVLKPGAFVFIGAGDVELVLDAIHDVGGVPQSTPPHPMPARHSGRR